MPTPVRYPVPEEIFTHLSGRTGRIIKWLLTQHVQDAIGGRDNWKITVNGKGDNIKTCIEVYKTLG
jgi:hypothetical protein